MVRRASQSGLVGYLFLLTGVFCLLQFSFMLQSSAIYFGDAKFIATQLHIPKVVIPAVVFYFFAQAFLQIVYTLMIWIAARLSGFALHLSWHRTQQLGFGLWVVATLFILFANALYFPNSKYTSLVMTLFPPVGIKIVFYLLSVAMMTIFLLSMLGILDLFISKRQWHDHQKSYRFILLLVLALIGLAFYPKPQLIAKDAATALKPNIIIVGVDALRPDFLSYFGAAQETPHMDAFLNRSVVFGEAFTPLARTFPSWVSILTGSYPKQTNARFDLPDPATLKISAMLPQVLQQQGYETMYGMDDVRFSNITHEMGFDKLVMPPVGFNDFFLGSFNDFPLSNLVVNTRLGRFLFPYSYGNRGVFITYEPNTYLSLWRDMLQKNRDKPLFIAVHFCLPHYPYFWGGYGPDQSKSFAVHYTNAVQAMDKQFDAFMSLLRQQNVLQHSIVILLSDHGEALEFNGDRITEKSLYIAGRHNPQGEVPHFYPPSLDKEEVNQSAGHGTDVLGLSQYHSVLAFAFEGVTQAPKPQLVSGVVSLMQVKPTLMNLLKLDKEPNGLESVITGKQTQVAMQNDFFLESDYSPQAIHTVHPEVKKVLLEGVNFYQINPKTAKITVKNSMTDMIVSSKQYADIYHDWILALYPEPNHHYKTILVNLNSGKWTDDLSTQFSISSPYKHMLAQLKKFYQQDICDTCVDTEKSPL